MQTDITGQTDCDDVRLASCTQHASEQKLVQHFALHRRIRQDTSIHTVHVCTHFGTGENMYTQTQTHMMMSLLQLRRGEPNQQWLYCFALSPSLLTAQNTQRSTSTKPGASSGGPKKPIGANEPHSPTTTFIFPSPSPCLASHSILTSKIYQSY